jgi:hypothetical protein
MNVHKFRVQNEREALLSRIMLLDGIMGLLGQRQYENVDAMVQIRRQLDCMTAYLTALDELIASYSEEGHPDGCCL